MGIRHASYALLLGIATAIGATAQPTVDFSQDIRPILADRCFHCHGPDEAARKANLRLDIESDAKAEVIVAGDIAASELIARITSTDPDDIMPPPSAQKPALTPEEVDLFKRWIAEGAQWEEHWAFVAPTKSEVPEASDWAASPIDAFIERRLTQAGLTPSAQASKEALLRRLSFDLTGLPPTIEEMDAFIADESPDAYERAVDRLLESPAYGEHMAAYWLDGARYADSNGYQNDFGRTMWPWRDWVINAFNANMPFDEFTVQQIAGDLLPNADDNTRIASGFNRNNRTVTEGGSINEEWRIENIVDRVETTSTVFLGLSMGCARCHEHKYDPVSQQEFYEFFAFFNNSTDEGHYNEVRGNVGATVELPTEENLARLAEFDAQIDAAKNDVSDARKNSKVTLEDWLANTNPTPLTTPRVSLPLNGTLLVSATGTAAAMTQSPALLDNPTFWPEAPMGKGLLLNGTAESHIGLAQAVTFEHDRPYTMAAWVMPDGAGAVLSKMDDTNAYRGVDILLGAGGEVAVHIVHQWQENAIKVVSATKIPMNAWSHIAVTYDGSSKAAGVRIYINGESTTIGTVEADSLNGSIHTEQPLRIGRRSTGAFFKGVVGNVAFYDELLSPDDIGAIVDATLIDATGGNENQQTIARNIHERRVNADLEVKQSILQQRMKAKADYKRDSVTTVMVMEEREERRPTYRLVRGAYDAPDESLELFPKIPAFLPTIPEGKPQDRLGLAYWLVSPENPLTSRVIVNRVWQQVFGRGLVRTPEDFGQQGQPPTHPELLDWLAVEFMNSGWDFKALHKRIVMSATYTQSSEVESDKLKADPENRLLARAPRYRLSAEAIRDNALAVSGLLVDKIGGPSVKPYQPEGLWLELAGGASQGPYIRGEGDDLYRRSLYTYRKRTVPPPMLTTFDAPSWEICRVSRARTNTPLQSLALLNDETYVEAARVFGARIIREGGDTPESRTAFGFRLATGRHPSAQELESLTTGLQKYKQKYSDDAEAAKQILSHGEKPLPEDISPQEHAAYTLLASVLLNLDETITRE